MRFAVGGIEWNASRAMIEVRGLTKVYETPGEKIRVLDELDFAVEDGGTASVVGPSGCGKSTLLNMLGALDRPTGGSVVIGGRDVAGMTGEEASRFRNRTLGFVFQQQHLLPQLTVLENVVLPRLAGGWEEGPEVTEDRARDLLETVGLGHRMAHLPYQLSGGEKLRTAVARALVNEPKLVLADEPTGALDEAGSAQVADLLLQLNAEREVTLVVVTHNGALADRMGTVWRLKDGKLEEA